jgi:hypothetical protein
VHQQGRLAIDGWRGVIADGLHKVAQHFAMWLVVKGHDVGACPCAGEHQHGVYAGVFQHVLQPGGALG